MISTTDTILILDISWNRQHRFKSFKINTRPFAHRNNCGHHQPFFRTLKVNEKSDVRTEPQKSKQSLKNHKCIKNMLTYIYYIQVQLTLKKRDVIKTQYIQNLTQYLLINLKYHSPCFQFDYQLNKTRK